MKILSFVNQKGGVGKTTSAVNVGAGLALQGKKVLLVDLDAQENLSVSLGKYPTENDATIYEILRGTAKASDAIIPVLYDSDNKYAKHIEARFDIIPADIRLAVAELDLNAVAGREMILKEALEEVKNNYDYIIIDCSPSLGILTLNALTASNKVYIPVQPEYLSLNGVAQLQQTIDLVQKRLNQALEIGAVIITMYDGRKSLNNLVLENLQKYFGNKVLNTRIPNNVALAEAPSEGQDIFRYKPKSKGAAAYKELVKEIMKVEG